MAAAALPHLALPKLALPARPGVARRRGAGRPGSLRQWAAAPGSRGGTFGAGRSCRRGTAPWRRDTDTAPPHGCSKPRERKNGKTGENTGKN